MIITKRGLLIGALIVLCIILAFFGPALVMRCQRQLRGVKGGVTLEGYPVGGLVEQELYDVVAGLAETFHVEASNATWNWQSGMVQAEVVGQVVDVQSTVEALLKAPAKTALELITVKVLPSITSAHFQPYYRGPASEPRVAFMVNVDWGNEFIEPLLDVFADFGVLATWFPTGRWASQTPELAKAIAAAGHEIGNHGGWHGMPSQMSRSEIARLIQEGEDAILMATGQKPQIFAPPAGDFNKQTVAVAAELGYKTVLWTVDTVDWQRPAPTVIVDRVIGRINNGSLVLIHPTKPTLEALPVILDHLSNRGFVCVTVSELLAD